MLSSGDLTKVLGVLSANRQMYLDKHKEDKVCHDVYAKRRSSVKIILGTSCNYSQSMRNLHEEIPKLTPKQDRDKDPGDTKAEIKVIKFDPSGASANGTHPTTTPGASLMPPTASTSRPAAFVFTKEKPAPPPAKSLLHIVELPPVRRREIQISIFEKAPSIGQPLLVMKVPVPEHAKVEEVIEDTRKQFHKEQGEELGTETGDFCLYTAEADGRPDEDFIALAYDQDIRKLGRSFCLVQRSGRRASLSMARPMTAIVRIQLPAGQYHTVAYQPDMRMKELIFTVCQRWNLDATEHAFRIGASGQTDLPPDTTMRDVDIHTNGKNDLFLIKKESKPEEEDVPDMPIWDVVATITLKQYDVMKIKKFSKRQERVLGISGDMITNEAPSAKKRATKRPVRFITDVKRVEQHKKRESQFTIRYNSDSKTYTYEAKTPELAREIVQKITTCLMLKNTPNST